MSHCLESIRLAAGLVLALVVQSVQSADKVVRHLTAQPPVVQTGVSGDVVDRQARADTLGFASGNQVSGHVWDAHSGQPLAGVWVIEVWEASNQSGIFCFDTDVTVSDAAGQFRMGTWTRSWRNLSSMPDKRLRLYAYKPNYELLRLDRRAIFMRPLEGPSAERLQTLRTIDEEYAFCQGVFSRENQTHDDHFRPLVDAMASEAEALPESSQQQTLAKWLRHHAAVPRGSDQKR